MERLSERIEEQLHSFAEAVAPLDAIPGVDQRTMEAVVVEIGVDRRPFPSDRHLTSWTGLCPGHHESVGKHTSGKTRQENRWLRTALT